jgi:hypothetical protein
VALVAVGEHGALAVLLDAHQRAAGEGRENEAALAIDGEAVGADHREFLEARIQKHDKFTRYQQGVMSPRCCPVPPRRHVRSRRNLTFGPSSGRRVLDPKRSRAHKKLVRHSNVSDGRTELVKRRSVPVRRVRGQPILPGYQLLDPFESPDCNNSLTGYAACERF